MYALSNTNTFLGEDEIGTLLEQALSLQLIRDKRVLVLIPDGTRTAPIPMMFRQLHRVITGLGGTLDFLIALGTHMPMSEGQIDDLVGVSPHEMKEKFPGVKIYNHDWKNPQTFVMLGQIGADEVAHISGGRLHEEVEVRINRLVTEYDLIIICGPVFPHEVVGFSGGNKYLFPGISGPEIINLSHWLGALITSYELIGTPGTTPVRRLIDRAASLVPTPKLGLSMVVAPGTNHLAGLYIDTPEKAWAGAVKLSAQLHVRYVERPFKRVLSIMPKMYDDIWTAAKGMYKLEPVVEDGGQLIIYAPHITEFSYTHGDLLAEVGYHVRDYFTGQWDKFKGYPGGILAHSTHLRGVGTYTSEEGEKPRIKVILATGISAERCAAHNLGYCDPNTINPVDWANRESEGILLVPKAGETLYRINQEKSPN